MEEFVPNKNPPNELSPSKGMLNCLKSMPTQRVPKGVPEIGRGGLLGVFGGSVSYLYSWSNQLSVIEGWIRPPSSPNSAAFSKTKEWTSPGGF